MTNTARTAAHQAAVLDRRQGSRTSRQVPAPRKGTRTAARAAAVRFSREA